MVGRFALHIVLWSGGLISARTFPPQKNTSVWDCLDHASESNQNLILIPNIRSLKIRKHYIKERSDRCTVKTDWLKQPIHWLSQTQMNIRRQPICYLFNQFVFTLCKPTHSICTSSFVVFRWHFVIPVELRLLLYSLSLKRYKEPVI